MEKRPVFEFYGALHSIRTHVSGHGRIELDCDKNCIHVLQALQRLQLEKGSVIAIAAVPLLPNEPLPKINVGDESELQVDGDSHNSSGSDNDVSA